jgi:hypothetical protein
MVYLVGRLRGVAPEVPAHGPGAEAPPIPLLRVDEVGELQRVPERSSPQQRQAKPVKSEAHVKADIVGSRYDSACQS